MRERPGLAMEILWGPTWLERGHWTTLNGEEVSSKVENIEVENLNLRFPGNYAMRASALRYEFAKIYAIFQNTKIYPKDQEITHELWNKKI